MHKNIFPIKNGIKIFIFLFTGPHKSAIYILWLEMAGRVLSIELCGVLFLHYITF